MQCRNCGTEIADKALICYKCGAPTTDAKYQPAPISRARGGRASLFATGLALVLLVVLALFLGRTPAGGTPTSVTIIVVVVAVLVVGLRAYARRR